ncbi:MAG: ferrochelatase [Gammaproteobacteria bacterium]|nr:ferrochelatase [Gammaproteobacteria bacterium]
MLNYQGEEIFQHDQPETLGVLITNLGTPDSPTSKGLRKYLKEFLSDRRVVEIPRLLWLLILHGIILRFRPSKSARAYQSIWTDEGSPLMVIGKRQQQRLQQSLSETFSVPVKVVLGMRYGSPSIASALEQLKAANARRIVVLPLYPQYASSTTGSTFEAVSRVIGRWRWIPELRFINQYHGNALYIEALANSVREQMKQNGQPEKLLMSFHGIPRVTQQDGDPYLCHCHKTGRLLAEKLGLSEDEYLVTFQSRFGKAEWIQPYTEQTLKGLAAEGVKHVAVVTPGFSADCLETLEEIGEENRGYFLQAGGEQYDFIPCLNERDDHMAALASIIEENTLGWSEMLTQRNAALDKTKGRAEEKKNAY